MTKEEKGGIPIMITKQMETRLRSFGFSETEISKLTPTEAWKKIKEKEELDAALKETHRTAEMLAKIDQKGTEEPLFPMGTEDSLISGPETSLNSALSQDPSDGNVEVINLSPLPPEAETPPEPKTTEVDTSEKEKEETLKKLQETIADAQKRLAENKLKREELLRELETMEKTFSADFIKERIKTLLESVPAVSEIKNIEVKGNSGEIMLTLAVVGKKGIFSTNIAANVTLEAKNGKIVVKNYKINASNFQGMVEGAIAPKIGSVPELIKSYIEKEENKKIAKIEINEGKLRIVFEKQ